MRTTILICGSREYQHLERVRKYIRNLNKDIQIVVGDAVGVDQTAAKEALKFTDSWVKVFPADWKRYGRRAGMVRNLEMLDQRPKLVIAFWDGESPGTRFMINTALKRNINLRVFFDI
jgi:hypothetical protein